MWEESGAVSGRWALVIDGGEAGTQVEAALTPHLAVRRAAGGAAALDALAAPARPALVVLGRASDDMTAEQVLAELRDGFLTAEIPVLALAAGDAAAQQLLRAGAGDALMLPMAPELLWQRAVTLIELHALRSAQRDSARQHEVQAAQRAQAAAQARDAAILAMACLGEADVIGDATHFVRAQQLFVRVARELRFHPRFADALTDDSIALMAQALPLHDIGTARVPREIVRKPGRLSADEFAQMKQHTVYGRDAIACVEAALGSSAFLGFARDIAHAHHERWDGTGYPQGLRGEAIPLSARLMAVVDVYGALTSARVYKPAFTHETAIELIRQGRGEQFDPDIVDALLAVEEQVREIGA